MDISTEIINRDFRKINIPINKRFIYKLIYLLIFSFTVFLIKKWTQNLIFNKKNNQLKNNLFSCKVIYYTIFNASLKAR